MWTWSCHEIGFMGPLTSPDYTDPGAARLTHPVLPVLYHHFGCVCPSYEALSIISKLVSLSAIEGVLEIGSGIGYWTYMLRRMLVNVIAVDNMESAWRTMWINDTIKANGVQYLKREKGARNRVLLMVYMVTKENFTQEVLRAYKGDTIVVVGTQNENRFTSFPDVTVEEYFEKEKKGFELTVRIALPSFAGKDEAMYVYERKKK